MSTTASTRRRSVGSDRRADQTAGRDVLGDGLPLRSNVSGTSSRASSCVDGGARPSSASTSSDRTPRCTRSTTACSAAALAGDLGQRR